MFALADALGIPECFALGVMEATWHYVAKYRQSGDVSDVNPAHLARAIRYPGDPLQLWAALIAAKWIDRVGDVISVHDWSEHADNAVHKYLKDKGLKFADGNSPFSRNRPRVEEASPTHDSVTTESQQSHDKSRLPEPEPEPAPAPKPRVRTNKICPSPTSSSRLRDEGSLKTHEQDWSSNDYRDFWNKTCPRYTQHEVMTEELVQRLRVRIEAGMTVDVFMNAVEQVGKSNNRSLSSPPGWTANLGWLFIDDNWRGSEFRSRRLRGS